MDRKKPLDIIEVIGRDIDLTEWKTGIFFGRCPFCHDMSFTIAQEKGIYKCFNRECSKGGNVINYLMYVKNMTYNEAVFEVDWPE